MIRHILFDLDNTLYPKSNLMDKKITERMFQFIADFLQVPFEDARILQRQHRALYGTTLEWLEKEHHFTDREAYFAAVHPPSELQELEPNPGLRGFLQSLNMPLSLLTNAPLAHAERVLRFFNIYDLFLGIFDITYHNGIGKPAPACFLTTLNAVNKTVEETLFLDDYPVYVKAYKALGGQAVLVDEPRKYAHFYDETGIPSIGSIYELPGILKNLS